MVAPAMSSGLARRLGSMISSQASLGRASASLVDSGTNMPPRPNTDGVGTCDLMRDGMAEHAEPASASKTVRVT